MKQEFSLAYCGGTENYYDRNCVQSGLFFQLVIGFSGKDLVQGD